MKTNHIMSQMKIRTVLVIASLAIIEVVQGQFKLYSTGSISIGGIIQPPANTEMQVIGNSLFSTTGSIKSAAFIQGNGTFSTPLIPDYSWWGNDSTGMFHPALNTIAFSINGVEAMRFTANQNALLGSQTDNGDRLQVTAPLNVNTLDLFSNASLSNIYSGKNTVNNNSTKAWAVENGATEEFYVLGNGQAYSYGWNMLSDSTLKENVIPISNALQKILRLQGVTYNYKKDRRNAGSTPQQMGLIAQAVERVVPEVVTTTDKGLKTIGYGNLVSLLVEALKQEDKKVEALTKRVDSLSTTEKVEDNDGTLNISIPVQSKNASVALFDLTGALKKSVALKSGSQKINLANELPRGIYYYSLIIDGKMSDLQKIAVINSENSAASASAN